MVIIQACISYLTIFFFISVLFKSTESFKRSEFHDDLSVVHTYDRITEVEKLCTRFLSSASELKPDNNRLSRLKQELSFYDGQWEQEYDVVQLFKPSNGTNLPMHSSNDISPLKMVGFEVNDVNPIYQFKNAISLRGTMRIGIASDGTHISNAKLKITYEGVYTETEENGGKRLLCMLGNTTFPSLDPFDNEKSHLLQDDRVMMVLHYPRVFNINNRVIKGKIRNLNEKGSSNYFDVVSLSSMLGPYAKYHFSPETLESRTCDKSLYRDELAENGVNLFNNSELCRSLKLFSGKEFTGKDEFGDIKLTMKHLICEDETARVAAVISKSPATMRAGLSVEGTWDLSTGQLCMLGCSILSNSGLQGCDAQVLLYFPRTLSIKQRSAIKGSISGIKRGSDWYFPISFLFEIHSLRGYHDYEKYVTSYQTYNYTIKLKSEPSKFLNSAKKMLFTYPSLGEINDQFTSLKLLSSSLDIHAYAVSEATYDRIKPEIFVNVEVLSLGSLLGKYFPENYRIKYQTQISNSEVLNVSLSLSFSEVHYKSTKIYYKNISILSLEGLYDPLLGKMYLIGCRKVEGGFDCLIQVTIKYSPQSITWLINPTAKIIIVSQRKKDDPLYFHPLNLETFMIMYNNYNDAWFRKVFEENLRIIILIFSIILLSSQLFYLRKNKEVVPYVSHTMLTLLLVTYFLPMFSINFQFAFEPKEDKIIFLFSTVKRTEYYLALGASLIIIRLTSMVTNSRKRSQEKVIMIITAVMYSLGYEAYFRFQRQVLISKLDDIQTGLITHEVLKYKEKQYIGLIQDTFLIPQIICNFIWKTRGKPLRKLYYIGFTFMRILVHIYDYIRDPIIHPYSDGPNVNGRSVFTSRAEKIVITVIMIVLAITLYLQQKMKMKHQSFTQVPLLSIKSSV